MKVMIDTQEGDATRNAVATILNAILNTDSTHDGRMILAGALWHLDPDLARRTLISGVIGAAEAMIAQKIFEELSAQIMMQSGGGSGTLH